MHGRVNVVTLDVKKDVGKGDYRMSNVDFMAFKILPLAEKLEKFKAIIKTYAEQLDPKELNIFIWGDGVLQSSSLGADLKNKKEISLFKDALSELSKEYPHIVIIGGAAVTTKQYENFSEEDFAKLRNAYQENDVLAELYKVEKNDREDKKETLKHYMNVVKEESARKQDPTLQQKPVNLTAVTSYVFQGGEVVHKYNKTAPIREGFDGTEYGKVWGLFKPRDNRKNLPIFELTHPTTGQPVQICLETCRDHHYGIAKHFYGKDPQNLPDIHFLMSDTMYTEAKNIYGKNFCQIDTREQQQTQFFSLTEDSGKENQIEISHYKVDALKELDPQIAIPTHTNNLNQHPTIKLLDKYIAQVGSTNLDHPILPNLTNLKQALIDKFLNSGKGIKTIQRFLSAQKVPRETWGEIQSFNDAHDALEMHLNQALSPQNNDSIKRPSL